MVTDNPGVQLPGGKDIKKLLKYLDKDGNGQIDETEFTKWLSDGANKTDAAKQKIRDNGNVTQIRFINFLDAVLHWLQPSEDRIREIFEASNHEHDGHMSMDDLKELVQKTHSLPIASRLGELPSTESDLKRLMDLIDDDHSGTIERKEFMTWLQKGIALMRALDGPQRVQYALKDPFNVKLINMYEALVDNWTTSSKITHEFPAGPLGLTFNQQKENGETVVHVLSIKPNSSAADCKQLRVGDIITAVNGESVQNMQIAGIVKLIQKAKRPLRLCFRHVDHARRELLENHFEQLQQKGGLSRVKTVKAQGLDEDEAAARIQAMQRGNRTRKDLQRQKEQHEAAAKIQARQRGKRTRKELEERQEAAAKIQAVQRGKQARKEQQEREEAAVKIQSVQRSRAARKRPEQRERQEQLYKVRDVWKEMVKGTRNTDGWVGASEILKGFKLLGASNMSTKEAQELAKYISKNNDGRVYKEEFETYCMKTLTEAKEAELKKRNKANKLNQLQEKDRKKTRGRNSNRGRTRVRGNNPRSPQSPKISPTPPQQPRRSNQGNRSNSNNNRSEENNESPRIKFAKERMPPSNIVTSLDYGNDDDEEEGGQEEAVINDGGNKNMLRQQNYNADYDANNISLTPIEQNVQEGDYNTTMAPMNQQQTWGNNNTFSLDTNTDITASMGRATGKQRMAARSRRVLKSLPHATQRELHAIHEVRSLTDTDNIPPSVLGNLHSLDPLQQVAACKRVQQQIRSWISAPLKDVLNEAIDWAEEQTYETLMMMNRRTPLAEPKLATSGSMQMIQASPQMQQQTLVAPQQQIEQQQILQQQMETANKLGVLELEKQERNSKIKSLDSDVRRLLRSIHRISSISNVGSDDIDRLKQLNKERQIHVLKRTRTMLLGEYENERAEVVLRKALPSRRVMNVKKTKPNRKAANKSTNAKAVSMGSHHSTVVPGYSYSPRNNNTTMPRQATYPPMGMNNGYFGVSPQMQQQHQQHMPTTRGRNNGNQPFNGAVYYNEGSPIAVFAGQEAQRSFPQYYNRG